jgi:hypothetical protein
MTDCGYETTPDIIGLISDNDVMEKENDDSESPATTTNGTTLVALLLGDDDMLLAPDQANIYKGDK